MSPIVPAVRLQRQLHTYHIVFFLVGIVWHVELMAWQVLYA